MFILKDVETKRIYGRASEANAFDEVVFDTKVVIEQIDEPLVECAGALYKQSEAPASLLDEVKSAALSRIDSATSAAILAGFEYTIDNEILHFSYDSFDQQNFADTANVATLTLSGIEGLPTSITWNAYRNYTPKTGGELVRLVLDSSAFLELYTKGALVHKAMKMEIGGQRKSQIESANTIEEIEYLLSVWKI